MDSTFARAITGSEPTIACADDGLSRYEHGPDATARMHATAMGRVDSAHGVVLVEGISDLIAVETVAERLGRDLGGAGVVVVPMGGAHAVVRLLTGLTARGVRVVGGLCDVREERFFRRGLAAAGIGTPGSMREMSSFGFHVCVDDLEQELIRAVPRAQLERLLDSQGDLVAFRTMQQQPEWRDARHEDQMHRWLRAGSRRNSRYARLLTQELDLDAAPAPLVGLVDSALARVG